MNDTLAQLTRQLLSSIDEKISFRRDRFKPFGCHDGVCLHLEENDTPRECCWHFSDYYCHYAGHSLVIAWLETYAERNFPLSTLLQEFAYFAVFLNNAYLVANLAHGISLFSAAFARRVIDPHGRKFKVAEKKFDETHISAAIVQSLDVNLAEVFQECGWKNAPFLPVQEAMESTLELNKKLGVFMRIIIANEARQKTRQKQFGLISRALLSLFCVDVKNIIGLFFIDFFAQLLPPRTYLNFALNLRLILHRMHGKKTSNIIMQHISNQACIRKIGQSLVQKDCLSRQQIEKQRELFLACLSKCRLTLLHFFHNYLLYMPKVLVFLHMHSQSLKFLDSFRIFVYEKNSSLYQIVNFSYENLVNSKHRANDDDPAIIVAPYCFNCGVYVDQIWSIVTPIQMPASVEKAKTFVCACSMARYCSHKCASLHYSQHVETCSSPNVYSCRSTNE